MKTRIFLFITILLLSFNSANTKSLTTGDNPLPKDALNVYTTPDLYPLTLKWVDEYGKSNPTRKIHVIKSDNKDIAGRLKTDSGIGFMSNESYASSDFQSNWSMVIGRDVIVPVMNTTNPLRDDIVQMGMNPEVLATILENPSKQSWGIMTGNSSVTQNNAIHYYFVNDPFIISGIAGFLNVNGLKPAGTMLASEKELIGAIQKDPNGLGFCRLIQIIDPKNQNMAEQIRLVPIDKNRNGKIDYIEAIYDNLQDFSRGLWIGKYPKSLSGNIYSVASSKPKDATELAFLNWVLTDGQQFLNTNGYSDLFLSERQTQLDKINKEPFYATTPASGFSFLKAGLLFILVLFVTGFIVDELVRRNRIRKSLIVDSASAYHPAFNESSIVIPKGLYFDKTHTWAYMKRNGNVKIGIDDFLQHVTGPLTRIELRKNGEKIKKGDLLLTIIQKGKQLNIYSPVTGTIKAHNSNLISDATLINYAPFTEGWIYMVEPANWLLELQFLTMAEKYKNWITEEFLRLKDFFASAVRIHAPAFALVLQDGGVLRDNILADLGPEVWEDFQTKFIDTAK
jgi:glycine cleavage system H lipoate-binding protein/ABC-type phosphate transport system substrate-binding protein